MPLNEHCTYNWYLLLVIAMNDDDDGDNRLLIEIVMMTLAIDASGVGDEKWW